jgi:hypothetical protein
MSIATIAILLISHTVTCMVCVWAAMLFTAFSPSHNTTALLTFTLIIIIAFLTLIYSLFKNLKLYKALGIILYLLLSPVFITLMYEVIFSISLIIELGDIGSIYNDTVLWLYIIYCFLYIFPLIVLFKIRHEKKSFVNSETIDGTDRDEP